MSAGEGRCDTRRARHCRSNGPQVCGARQKGIHEPCCSYTYVYIGAPPHRCRPGHGHLRPYHHAFDAGRTAALSRFAAQGARPGPDRHLGGCRIGHRKPGGQQDPRRGRSFLRSGYHRGRIARACHRSSAHGAAGRVRGRRNRPDGLRRRAQPGSARCRYARFRRGRVLGRRRRGRRRGVSREGHVRPRQADAPRHSHPCQDGLLPQQGGQLSFQQVAEVVRPILGTGPRVQ